MERKKSEEFVKKVFASENECPRSQEEKKASCKVKGQGKEYMHGRVADMKCKYSHQETCAGDASSVEGNLPACVMSVTSQQAHFLQKL